MKHPGDTEMEEEIRDWAASASCMWGAIPGSHSASGNLWPLNFQTNSSCPLNVHCQTSNQRILLCWQVS